MKTFILHDSLFRACILLYTLLLTCSVGATLTSSQKAGLGNADTALNADYGNILLTVFAKHGPPVSNKCNLEIKDGKFYINFWETDPKDKPKQSHINVSINADDGEPKELMPYTRIVQKKYGGSISKPMHCSEGTCSINILTQRTDLQKFATSIQKLFGVNSAHFSCVLVPIKLLNEYYLTPEIITTHDYKVLNR